MGADEGGGKEGSRGKWVKWANPISWANWIKVLAGAFMAVVAVVVFFFPGCEPPKPCRGALGGTLSDSSIDRNLTYGSYLELIGASKGGASPERLREVGVVIDFRVETEGYKDKALNVTWWLLTKDGAPISNLRYRDQLGSVVTPQDCKDKGRLKIWVGPIPAGRRDYRAEIRLLDPNGVELDQLRTGPFPGLG